MARLRDDKATPLAACRMMRGCCRQFHDKGKYSFSQRLRRAFTSSIVMIFGSTAMCL